ncbi:carbohydrate esterase family 4 protein [Botryobasidium botryosum FD-172 SS1]|uniref:chitin deacetylase n=1 Tax=Botryobasidium botryosum (strain FD-172 SS1) TaxID=930990 RepID=A0A067MU78_BOTB1|nr:carbohydrate esterase family 4 protein [Botryobasidium botryosum FD-172 SS1]
MLASSIPFLALLALASAVSARDKWYHPRDHPVHDLFKRQAPALTPGSPEWVASYPAAPLTAASVSAIPAAWLAALDAATKAGLIPSIAPATLVNGAPTYSGQNSIGPEICSSTGQCRGDPTLEVWDAPDGKVAVSFDDGPLPTSGPLYDFLKQNNQHATHFFIGSNVRDNYAMCKRAYDELNDEIGVHTWSHQYTTSLSNEVIVGELGYTMQIIAECTGGRLPKWWRPPYGDSDNRVRAIAYHVFGGTCAIWNHDTDDWELDQPNTTVTAAGIAANLQTWYAGAKHPGLMILEHELSTQSVQAFIDNYPLIKTNGWDARGVADVFGATYYLNAVNNTTPVVPLAVAAVAAVPSSLPGTAVTSSTAAATATASGTPSGAGLTTTATPKSSKNGAVGLRGSSSLLAVVMGSIVVGAAALM